MARNYTLEVNGKEFSGSTASASDQLEALQVIAGYDVILAIKDGTSDQATALLFLRMEQRDFAKVVDLLVKDHVTRARDNVPAGPNLFQDDIASYALLVGLVARENLSGFYELRTENGGDEPKQ